MIQHYLIPLSVEGETVRASLVLDDTGTKGTIKFDGKPVCGFELESAWAVPNYFVAEKLTRNQLTAIMGITAEPVSTGFRP